MIDQIIQGVFLGEATSVIGANGKRQINKLKICRVLTSSVMPIKESDRLPDVEYKFIFMMDEVTQDILGNGLLKEALLFIEESVCKNINVLVHCEFGISRSVALVAAYVMRKFQWNVDKALMFIQKSRPIASPNISFLQQLCIFEHLGYRLDAVALGTSILYRNYCADNGTIPIPTLGVKTLKTNDEKKLKVNEEECKRVDNRAAHSLSDCLRWARRRFRCRRCRTELFYDLHLMYHAIGNRSKRVNKMEDTAKEENFENDAEKKLETLELNNDNKKLAPVEKDTIINTAIDNKSTLVNSSDLPLLSIEETTKYNSALKILNNEDLVEGSRINEMLLKKRCTFEYLITPMKWMLLDEFQGKIFCPKCQEKLGQYIWGGRYCVDENHGDYKGGCGAFITPWVHIQKCKVDVSNITNNTNNNNNKS